MKSKKIFDFDLAIKLGRSPRRMAWYKENYRKPITEDVFIETMLKFKNLRRGQPRNYQKSRLRTEYKKLKTIFGFFNPQSP